MGVPHGSAKVYAVKDCGKDCGKGSGSVKDFGVAYAMCKDCGKDGGKGGGSVKDFGVSYAMYHNRIIDPGTPPTAN